MPSSASSKHARIVGFVALSASLGAALLTTACAAPSSYGGTGYLPARSSYGGAAQGNGQWARVAPPATGVSLELPRYPDLKTQHGRTSDGGQQTTTEGEVRTVAIHYNFFVTEFEAGVDRNPALVLDEYVDEFIAASDGAEIRSSGPVDRRGFPGTELVVYRYDEDVVMRVRMWVGRTRAYVFSAATKANDAEATRASLDRYFDSIAIEPRDAPGPDGDGSLLLDAWQTIYPPTDSFAVQIPGAPTANDVEVTLAGKDAEGHAYRVARSDQRVRFAVEVLDFDEHPPLAAIDAIVATMTSRGFSVRDVRDTERQGYPARAVSLASATDVVYAVFVVQHSRLFVVSLAVPIAEEAAFVPHRQRFFRSFRIL